MLFVIMQLSTPHGQILLQYLSVLARASEMSSSPTECTPTAFQGVARVDAIALRIWIPIGTRTTDTAARNRAPGELVVVLGAAVIMLLRGAECWSVRVRDQAITINLRHPMLLRGRILIKPTNIRQVIPRILHRPIVLGLWRRLRWALKVWVGRRWTVWVSLLRIIINTLPILHTATATIPILWRIRLMKRGRSARPPHDRGPARLPGPYIILHHLTLACIPSRSIIIYFPLSHGPRARTGIATTVIIHLFISINNILLWKF